MPYEVFQTSDLALAAYLMIQAYEVVDVLCESGGKATFHFRDRPQRPDIVLKFFNRQTTVEPIAFLDHVKSLKAMLKQ